jgi:hypothetical protein
MATQTRRTTRRSARFFRATVKAYMVTSCCGLVLLSAVAAHAALTENGMPMNGLPMNGATINGLYVNGLTVNGLAPNATMLSGEPAPGVQSKSLPFNGLSQRALGKPQR